MAFEHRVKLFVSENHRLVVALLLLGGVLCLVGAGYVFSTPTTQTITEETDQQTFETRVGSSALVTRPTALYEQGERLENRSVYFLSASPSMRFEANTTVPSGQRVSVAQRLELEILGTRDGQPFYRSTRTLIETNETVSDGRVTASETVNVSAVGRDLAVLLEDAQDVGQFRLRLLLEVTYSTGEYEGTLRSTAPFVIQGQSYYIDGALAAEETESTFVEREVTQPPSPAEYGGLAAVGLLLFGVAAVVSRLEDRVDPEELRTQIVHDQHAEWISRGQFPTDSEKQYISILTLEDLVDVAIDTNRRVIHDPQIDAYAVIDSSEIYYYALDEIQADEWLDI
ncbi:DUF5305 domain-containing protein [Halobellus limi]|uniref:DUF5305 domain-containing protein n=1 Tax=Halobellus limi TaxID=699433 RepID=A0A1H5TR24_9EURY|nr:DUF5305 domain-containing protein [Halobellus limi]QCC47253.1 hypothetical protein DV707_05970 [Halobellus limi]SEF65234.1 hypothetical protein SAMN04488133_0355 [Halobellus limi]